MSDYEFWLKRKKDGKTVLANWQWVNQYLGISDLQRRMNNLEDSIKGLEYRIRFLERPLRKQKILKLLAEDGKPRTMRWLAYRMREIWIQDLWELEKEGKLGREKHGHHLMFYILGEGG